MACGTGAIDAASVNDRWTDPDYWRIELLAGDRISVRVDPLNDSEVDPYIELRGGADAILSSDDNSGPATGSFASNFEVPSSGIYYVRVGKNAQSQSTGEYQLNVDVGRGIGVESDASYANDSSPETKEFRVRNGERSLTVAGVVMAPEGTITDSDRFNLGVLNSGVVVELDAESLLPSESTLLPWVRVLNSRGEPLPDEDGNPLDGRYRVTIPDSDTYSAELRSFWTYGGSRYAMTNISSSWEAVEAEAAAVGGHLVTINDLEENDWLQQTLSPFGEFWIGLNDQDVEGTFIWSSGEVADYENWLGGQPAGGTNENFVVMRRDGLWDDRHTTTMLRGLIEIPGAADDPALYEPGDPFAQYVLQVNISDPVPPQGC